MIRAWILVVAASSVLSCGSPDVPALQSPPTSHALSSTPPAVSTEPAPTLPVWSPADYKAVVEQAIDTLLRHDPVFATREGDHRFDDKWPALTKEAQSAEGAECVSRAIALRTLATTLPQLATDRDRDAAGTDRPELDAQVLADRLESRAYDLVAVRRFEHDSSAVVEVIGGGITSLTSHDYAPKKDRMASLTTRLRGVPDLLNEARARLQRPTVAGLENMQIVTAGIAGSLRTTFAKMDAASVDNDKAALDLLHKSALEAAAALESYAADVLKKWPVSTADKAPIGSEKWATLARLVEGVTDTPAEIRKMGETEAARLTGELDALIGEFEAKAKKEPVPTEPKPRTVAERAAFLHLLEKDAPPADKLLDAYRQANKGVEEWLRTHPFATIPWEKVQLEIVQSPAEARGTSFASMNTAGPLEPKLADARFEVNIPDSSMPPARRAALSAFHSRGAMEMVSVHEALPGHYLQNLVQRRSPSKVRKIVWAATLGEGWAHYCEEAMMEAGYGGNDPLRTRAFYLRMALQRAARVIVDVGENDGSLSMNEGAKVLQDVALLSPEAARIEARRALVWPANMFAYTYGKLAILRIREAIKAREGDKFDLVRFHDRLLAVGAVPIGHAGRAAFGVE